MNQHPNALAAKVAAVNLCHTLANQYGAILRDFFRPYVGQKVLKTDGSFLESFKKQLPELPSWQTNRAINVNLTTGGGYSIRLDIRVSQGYTDFRGNYSTLNYETSVYIADLTSVGTHDFNAPKQYVGAIYDSALNYQTDYKAEQIIQLRKCLEDAEKVVSDLKSKLHSFGTYDR